MFGRKGGNRDYGLDDWVDDYDYEEEYSEDEVAFGTDTFAANTDEYGVTQRSDANANATADVDETLTESSDNTVSDLRLGGCGSYWVAHGGVNAGRAKMSKSVSKNLPGTPRDWLPIELWHIIFKHIATADIISLSKTCSDLRNLVLCGSFESPFAAQQQLNHVNAIVPDDILQQGTSGHPMHATHTNKDHDRCSAIDPMVPRAAALPTTPPQVQPRDATPPHDIANVATAGVKGACDALFYITSKPKPPSNVIFKNTHDALGYFFEHHRTSFQADASSTLYEDVAYNNRLQLCSTHGHIVTTGYELAVYDSKWLARLPEDEEKPPSTSASSLFTPSNATPPADFAVVGDSAANETHIYTINDGCINMVAVTAANVLQQRASVDYSNDGRPQHLVLANAPPNGNEAFLYAYTPVPRIGGCVQLDRHTLRAVHRFDTGGELAVTAMAANGTRVVVATEKELLLFDARTHQRKGVLREAGAAASAGINPMKLHLSEDEVSMVVEGHNRNSERCAAVLDLRMPSEPVSTVLPVGTAVQRLGRRMLTTTSTADRTTATVWDLYGSHTRLMQAATPQPRGMASPAVVCAEYEEDTHRLYGLVEGRLALWPLLERRKRFRSCVPLVTLFEQDDATANGLAGTMGSQCRVAQEESDSDDADETLGSGRGLRHTHADKQRQEIKARQAKKAAEHRGHRSADRKRDKSRRADRSSKYT